MGVIRDIDKLKPELARRTRLFLSKAKEAGLQLTVVETLRMPETQKAYYAQGRSNLETVNELRIAAGLPLINAKENSRIITKTLQSRHFGGNAVDIAPVKNGRVWWTAPQEVWEKMGALGEVCGLDWCAGGRSQVWGKGWDNPHFELMQ
jgi:hypothetical protein